MASKKDVLAQLNRTELLALVDQAGVEVSDRRVRDQLVTALAASRRARLPEYLNTFSRDRLKELSRKLGGDGAGRDKSAIVDAILGSGAKAISAKSASAPAAARGNGKAAPKSVRRRVAAGTQASPAPLRAVKAARKTTGTKV